MAILVSSPACAAPLIFDASVQVSGDEVRLGQIADLSALPPTLRSLAAQLVMAKFPAGQSRMRLSQSHAGERARALMPALATWLPFGAEAQDIIEVSRIAPPESRSRPQRIDCLKAKIFLPAGIYPRPGDFEPVTCRSQARERSFRYASDTGAVKTVRDIEPGDLIDGVPASTLAQIQPGQPLVARTRVGVVTVERQVDALTPSAQGRALFVKAADGLVFAAPPPQSQQAMEAAP